MSDFDFVSGEEIVLRASLRKDRWMKYRCVRCSLACAATVYLAPLCIPIYALFGVSCREEEADSFELVLTNQNIHFRQKLFGCGICCQQTQNKVIPLHRIQDISLVSDWIGDSCGVVDKAGEAYQIQVQTAAMGTPLPELCVYCIDNPREFKQKVLEAKNRMGTTESVGQSKSAQTVVQNTEDVSRILALLQQAQSQPQQPAAV
jgi:hypothetical protein